MFSIYLLCLIIFIFRIIFSGRIHIRKTKVYDWVWSDHGTGSTDDASFWKPRTYNDNEFFITFHAGNGHSKPNEEAIVITNAPEGVLKIPLDSGYTKMWDDRGSHGDHDVMFIKPKPYSGYICFGDYIVRDNYDGDIANYGRYRCIHKDYVKAINDRDRSTWIWNDHDSGAKEDGSIFRIYVDGLPYRYYRTSNDHASAIGGPYYYFQTYLDDCKVIKIQVNNNNNLNDFIGVTADYTDSSTFENSAYQEKSAVTLEQQKCATIETKFIHSIGYELSLSILYSKEFSAGVKLTGTSVTKKIEVTLGAKHHQNWQRENSESKTECSLKSSEKLICPPRSRCIRHYIALKPITKTVPLKITLECPVNRREIIYGTFESSGILKYLITNEIIPLDCPYYSTNINGINFGKLPHCDRCTSNIKCLRCRDNMVLTNGICVTNKVCEDDCNGQTKGSMRDGTSKQIPFTGAFCKNENLTLLPCYKSLNPDIQCMDGSYLYNTNNNMLNNIKNDCGLDGKCNKRLYDFSTIKDCYNRCLNHPKCKSYTINNFINNNNNNNKKQVVCTIYDSIKPNDKIENQKMCIMNFNTKTTECIRGSKQVKNNNGFNDINSCGLESCDKRLFDGTINDCYNRCLNNSECLSYTFSPKYTDPHYMRYTVCTIYNERVPNNKWGEQIMCIMDKCESGSTLIQQYNGYNDINNCGLENCNNRLLGGKIIDCYNRCLNNPKCESYSFSPNNTDPNHLNTTVCTIYDNYKLDHIWGQQLMCVMDKCSDGSHLLLTYNGFNDIDSCGIDVYCNNRLFDGTINDCYNRCLNNKICKSYTFSPKYTDPHYMGNTVCTIYDSIIPNNKWGEQRMCIMN